MASTGTRAYKVLGAVPPVGSRGRAPGRGQGAKPGSAVRGQSPLKLIDFIEIGRPK